MTLSEMVMRNKDKYDKYKDRFFKTFNAHLSKFWTPMFGFDVIKFDDNLIQAPDNQSTAKTVEKKYGKAALKLVNELLKVEKS